MLEAVIFCCLVLLVTFWFADRLRSVDFDPIAVMPCTGAECEAYVGAVRGHPWSVYSDTLDQTDMISFSSANVCIQLAETLALRGEQEQGVDLILDLITARGTVAISRPDDGTIVIGPGDRNDSFGDALRDAMSWTPTRGCNPMNYTPVFWPLWVGWMLLANLRWLRSRQAIWSKR